ncbi:MAG TPA: ribonuclease H-like domain-containing protein [Lachnospiraceae bacterium]|nr:ribonuclease H-like domain-containing protein [Lachnospiraceae bacterium]
MKTIQKTLLDLNPKYPLEELSPIDKILFFDIETTGFSSKSSSLYLIGCLFYDLGNLTLIQWFSEGYNDELNVLEAFFSFSKNYNYLIHFNGNNFDLPYLQQKFHQYNLPYNFDQFKGTDIYKRIAPFKSFLKLPNCKQKTLETYLNMKREDMFNGGELISVYHDYVKSPNDISYQSLLLHNEEDLIGMLEILPVLAYVDLFNKPLTVKKVQANYYKDFNGDKHQEIIMKLRLPVALPVAISNYAFGCFFSGLGYEGTIKVPLIEDELKYFYSNYRDYYYLPLEDVALHKSVAAFVDKEHRKQATAATCYTRKFASYLPQWEILFEPFFKKDYKSNDLYFELTDDLKKERNIFSKYATHILQVIATKSCL